MIVVSLQWWTIYGVFDLMKTADYGNNDNSWTTDPNCTIITYNFTTKSFEYNFTTKYSYKDPSSFFYANFILPGRPAIIKGAMYDWKAVDLWTNDYLKEKIGNITVKMTTGNRTQHFGAVSHQMQFPEFVDKISDPNLGDIAHYMSTQKNYYRRPDGQEIEELLDIPKTYLSGDYIEPFFMKYHEPFEKNMWFGPGGIVSHLHRDPAENVMCMVSGEKIFVIFPYNEAPNLYPYEDKSRLLGRFSQVNIDKPDLEKFPDMKKAKPMTCHIKEGEMLFLPSNWWHQVYTIDRNLALNFWYHFHSPTEKFLTALKMHLSFG